MTLTKTDIIESIYNQCDFSKTKADKLVEVIWASPHPREDSRCVA